MFANLESFSIFFFVSLAFIVIAIAFEDKLIALEKKHDKKSAARRNARKASVKASGAQAKCRTGSKSEIRRMPAPQRRKNGIAA